MSKFIISSNLKNHIWKDLITNDIVAIFELVKNSYDAEATHVTIEFLGDQIIIADNGYWMSYDDIEKKWLFVWYSSKVDADDDWIIKETRNQTKNFKRSYAWAKGVGRFACDRLWSHLVLYSKKEWWSESKLVVPWDQFEEDMNKEFWSIDVELEKSSDYKIKNEWTILIISNLRDNRDRQKKWRLKKQLMKLISPLEEKNNNIFNIEIISKDEIEQDEQESKIRKKINGVIINDTLETIKNYTVYIDFLYNNWVIKLSLYDRGRYVFSYSKNSESYDQLEKIHWTIYYLNTTAKSEFKKLMWEHNTTYWSIFLFKNTIRVYPFWEEWEDTFWLDARKNQWYARFLWVRELLGYVDIKDSKNKLMEKTSRDWWFLENETYTQLKNFILNEGIYKLEKYVVEALSWTENRKADETYLVENRIEQFKSFIQKQLKEKDIVIELWKEFESILEEKDILTTLKEKTKWTDLSKDIWKIVDIVRKTNQQKNEIQTENEKNKTALENEKNKTRILERQNEFLQDTQNISKEKIIWNIHDIGIITDNLDVLLGDLLQAIQGNEELFKSIFLNIQKIKTIVAFATNSDYRTNTWTTITTNIIQFMHERTNELSKNWWIKLQYTDNSKDLVFETKFSPVDINTILLNLISNSKKARAKEINLFFEKENNRLKIYYNDNGRWIDETIKENLFSLWVTTTNWSWVWLFIVSEIMKSMNWSIVVTDNGNYQTWWLWGASFLLTI